MLKTRALFALCLSFLVTGLAPGIPAGAADGHGRQDNSGRKLAVLTAAPAEDVSEERELVIDLSATRAGRLLNKLGSSVFPDFETRPINFNLPELPAELRTLTQECRTTGSATVGYLRDHAVQLGSWLAQYMRQMASPPRVSPLTAPYRIDRDRLVPSDIGERTSGRFVTSEGRLKTVVAR
ncbi:MAG: hypothetical protein IPM23_17255 [Candidatus Melainabacteria bacterium]|nr:hypothetical protein [Candidatus Melainabacteria bacterium]